MKTEMQKDIDSGKMQSAYAKTAHTPTPWKIAPDEPLIVETMDGKEIADCSMLNKSMPKIENAAFIVRAVNRDHLFEELLKALKMQINWHMRDGSPCACPAGEGESDYKGKMPTLHSTACVALREALARAEGK